MSMDRIETYRTCEVCSDLINERANLGLGALDVHHRSYSHESNADHELGAADEGEITACIEVVGEDLLSVLALEAALGKPKSASDLLDSDWSLEDCQRGGLRVTAVDVDGARRRDSHGQTTAEFS